MEGSKLHFRHSLRFLFDLKKSVAEANQTLLEVVLPYAMICKTCWTKHPTKTLKELSNNSVVDESTVSRPKIQKEGK